MSKADEMFEKLGYRIYDDIHSIVYCLHQNFAHFKVIKKIYFYKLEKDICIAQWNVTEGIKIITNITMQELQAINEKVKELGWNE